MWDEKRVSARGKKQTTKRKGVYAPLGRARAPKNVEEDPQKVEEYIVVSHKQEGPHDFELKNKSAFSISSTQNDLENSLLYV